MHFCLCHFFLHNWNKLMAKMKPSCCRNSGTLVIVSFTRLFSRCWGNCSAWQSPSSTVEPQLFNIIRFFSPKILYSASSELGFSIFDSRSKSLGRVFSLYCFQSLNFLSGLWLHPNLLVLALYPNSQYLPLGQSHLPLTVKFTFWGQNFLFAKFSTHRLASQKNQYLLLYISLPS